MLILGLVLTFGLALGISLSVGLILLLGLLLYERSYLLFCAILIILYEVDSLFSLLIK